MVCPTPRSGRYGFIGDYTGSVFTRYSRFQNWTLDIAESPEVRYYSGTKFGPQRVAGNVEYTGSFQAYGASPPLFVGDSFTALMYAAPTNGVPCSPGCAVIVPAIVDTLTITWNWTPENRTVSYNIGFSLNGSPSEDTSFDDDCDDELFCDNPCDLELVIKDPCDNNSVVEFCNLTQAVLTFTASNQTYGNSSTNCEQRKVPGNLDFTLAITEQNPCLVLEITKDYRIEIDATPTTKWILEWARLLGLSNYSVNAQTAEIISKTDNFAMQGVLCCSDDDDTPTLGQIIHPDGTVLWPASSSSSSA